MSKKLNQWLDEFVDNGADASDVVNWPENAGGGGSNENGVNFIPVDSMLYRLDVDELIRVVTLMEQNEEDVTEIRYAYYMSGHGGSGVEFSYGVSINDSTITLPNDNEITLTSLGTISRTLTENKAIIENTTFTFDYVNFYIGVVVNSSSDLSYPIDLTKLFIPVEE